MINLIITNESYKKIKIFLAGSVKFFLGREAKSLLYYLSEECKWIWMNNVFESGFNFC
jgi:hypothetical protein